MTADDVRGETKPRALTFCPGCRRQDIPRHRFACRPCWYRLPADLRREISANYRRNPTVHRQAIRDGLRWFRDNPKPAQPAPGGDVRRAQDTEAAAALDAEGGR